MLIEFNSNERIGFYFHTSKMHSSTLEMEVSDLFVPYAKTFFYFDYIQSGFGRRDIGALLHLKDRIKTNQGNVPLKAMFKKS